MVEYALKHGVTKTAIKYNTYRQYVYLSLIHIYSHNNGSQDFN